MTACISNPPYNIKWDHPILCGFDDRFIESGIPPKSNANFAFILTAIKECAKSVFILPNGVLSPNTKEEKQIVKWLIEKNYIDLIILCPDKMFESTSIGTCIIIFNKNKNDNFVKMYDARKLGTKETREQNGQHGGNSHTKRTYKKEINIFSDETIENILSFYKNGENKTEISKIVDIEEIKRNDYILIPSRYIDFEEKEAVTRSYDEIIRDLNKIILEKNKCKLTINENLAKNIGFDVELLKKKSDYKEFNDFLQKVSSLKLEKENYFTTSKSKNEIKFENGSKDELSSILMMIMQMWKQHIYYLNKEENKLLVELRDKMLPDLMSGKIEIQEGGKQ